MCVRSSIAGSTLTETCRLSILEVMNTQGLTDSFFSEAQKIVSQPNMFRSILILIASILIAYWLSRFLAHAIVWTAEKVSSRGDKETDDVKNLRYRQVETYLSITVAAVRVVATVIVGYVAWTMLSPFKAENAFTANGIAAIGAGTIFILFAGQTIGIILRDLTAGAIMITEGWFHVGDFIKIDPYPEVAGVVERFTLRSTRLRALNGEIVWIHNQHIIGVRVTPRGVRTIAVEIFVRDKEKGLAAIKKMIAALPSGKTMLARKLEIETVEPWADDTWHLTVTGQTPPGREWLIENYFFEAVRDIDEGRKRADRILSHPPMVHNADMIADKRFKRAVRVKGQS